MKHVAHFLCAAILLSSLGIGAENDEALPEYKCSAEFEELLTLLGNPHAAAAQIRLRRNREHAQGEIETAMERLKAGSNNPKDLYPTTLLWNAYRQLDDDALTPTTKTALAEAHKILQDKLHLEIQASYRAELEALLPPVDSAERASFQVLSKLEEFERRYTKAMGGSSGWRCEKEIVEAMLPTLTRVVDAEVDKRLAALRTKTGRNLNAGEQALAKLQFSSSALAEIHQLYNFKTFLRIVDAFQPAHQKNYGTLYDFLYPTPPEPRDVNKIRPLARRLDLPLTFDVEIREWTWYFQSRSRPQP